MYRYAISLLHVLVISQSLAGETVHVVTATTSQWIYRDTRSGLGESNPVRIFASPGDTIKFQQIMSGHGVIFYRNPSNVTEIGRVVNPKEEFKILNGEKLSPVSKSRVFGRENLATRVIKDETEMITIRLVHNFRGPLYFAERVSASEGRDIMFGIIELASASRMKSISELELPENFKMSSAIDITSVRDEEWDRSLGNLSQLPNQEFIVPRQGEDPVGFNWEKWFGNLTSHLSPYLADVTWYYAVAVDLDDDDDDDVVALIETANAEPAWYAIINGVKSHVQDPGNPSDLLGEINTFTAAVKIVIPEQVDEKRAFIKSADLNLDGRVDLVLCGGGDARITIAYQGFIAEPPGYAYANQQTLDSEIVFGIEKPRVVDVENRNDDSMPDLVICGNSNWAVFLNRIGRGFSSTDAQALDVKPPFADASVRRFGKADLNGDHSLELIIENKAGELRAYSKSADGKYFLVKKGATR